MQIDHIDGKGHQHKQKSGRRYKGEPLYRWLRRNNYPEGFQILCADCNTAKGTKSECPCKAARARLKELFGDEYEEDTTPNWLFNG